MFKLSRKALNKYIPVYSQEVAEIHSTPESIYGSTLCDELSQWVEFYGKQQQGVENLDVFHT